MRRVINQVLFVAVFVLSIAHGVSADVAIVFERVLEEKEKPKAIAEIVMRDSETAYKECMKKKALLKKQATEGDMDLAQKQAAYLKFTKLSKDAADYQSIYNANKHAVDTGIYKAVEFLRIAIKGEKAVIFRHPSNKGAFFVDLKEGKVAVPDFLSYRYARCEGEAFRKNYLERLKKDFEAGKLKQEEDKERYIDGWEFLLAEGPAGLSPTGKTVEADGKKLVEFAAIDSKGKYVYTSLIDEEGFDDELKGTFKKIVGLLGRQASFSLYPTLVAAQYGKPVELKAGDYPGFPYPGYQGPFSTKFMQVSAKEVSPQMVDVPQGYREDESVLPWKSTDKKNVDSQFGKYVEKPQKLLLKMKDRKMFGLSSEEYKKRNAENRAILDKLLNQVDLDSEEAIKVKEMLTTVDQETSDSDSDENRAHLHSVTCSPNWKYFIVNTYNEKFINLRDLTTGECIWTFQHPDYDETAATSSFSPDGKFLGVRLTDIWYNEEESKFALTFLDVSTGECVKTIREDGFFDNFTFSPDGRVIASSASLYVEDSNGSTGFIKQVKLWDAAPAGKTEELKTINIGHTKIISGLVFSPDGKFIASASYDGAIKLWEVSSGECVREYTDSRSVESVAFSPDGKFIAGGSANRIIKLWDASTGKCLRTFTGHSTLEVDGRSVGNVESVAFSPDGKLIVSGGKDRTIKLWDVSTGECIRTFIGHTDMVMTVAFSPDGKNILSGGWDNTVRLWRVPQEDS